MRISAILIGLLFTSACMSEGDPVESLQSRAVAADVLVTEVQGYAPTSLARMPDTGSAQFNGYSALVIDPVAALDVDDILLLGDATLNVTFADAGTVTGYADNFEGIVGTGNVSQLANASGSIQIGDVDSSIGQGRPANEWTSNYGGTVTVNGQPYTVSCTLDGGFFGNRTSQPDPDTIIKGIAGNDFDGLSVNGNGGLAPVGFEVFGTNPV